MKTIGILIFPLLLFACLAGCERSDLFELAKYGVDRVYALGYDGMSTKLYIARPGYYQQYDTMTSISFSVMAAGGGAVFASAGTPIYSPTGSLSSTWNSLPGIQPNSIFNMVDSDGEVLVLGDWTAIYYLCRLYRDSFTKLDAFEEKKEISSLLGSYYPLFMFKAAGSGKVYLVALFDDVTFEYIKIFSVSGGGVSELGTYTMNVLPGTIQSAGKKGDYIYMLNAMGVIYRMSLSNPGMVQEYSAVSASSIAVTESGIYSLYTSADGHLTKFDEETGLLSATIRTFIGASSGEVLPFDREGIAIRLSGGTEQGVWIYKDGDFKQIVNASLDTMYVQ